MESPQSENGHVRIANEIWDALCNVRIPGEARQVLDVILRKTYGWNKKEDIISLSQFQEMTGLSKVHIIRARGSLLKINLIVVTQKGNGSKLSYRFNKFYSTWKPLPKKVTLPKKVIPITQKGKKPLPKKVPTKDKERNTKEKPKTSPKIFYSFELTDWMNIKEKDMEQWKKTYPACDIKRELLKAGDWLVSNPTKIKSNYRKFISGWLSRSQDRGGTDKQKNPTGPKMPSPYALTADEVAELTRRELRKGEE